MKVRKTTITITVLSPGAEHLEFDSLEDLGRYVENGEGIAGFSVDDSVVLTDPGGIRDELYRIGNDGNFFDEDLK